MIRSLFKWKSPAGPHARLSILIFHRVFPSVDPIFPSEMDARRFSELCGWMRSWFNVLSLDQAVEKLKNKSLPERAACITFDDGYADNHDVALPILRQHGLPATFFVATGFLDGGRMWNDTVIEAIRRTRLPHLDLGGLGQFRVGSDCEKRLAIASILGKIKYLPIAERLASTDQVASAARVDPPSDLMMTSRQVKAMRHSGMQIGAHTVSHPILARLPLDEAAAEIKGSKDFLEQLLGERIGLFAYPNGKPEEDYHAGTVGCVRAIGFDAAVTTHWAAAAQGVDVLQIPRFTPWDTHKFRFGLRLLSNLQRRPLILGTT